MVDTRINRRISVSITRNAGRFGRCVSRNRQRTRVDDSGRGITKAGVGILRDGAINRSRSGGVVRARRYSVSRDCQRAAVGQRGGSIRSSRIGILVDAGFDAGICIGAVGSHSIGVGGHRECAAIGKADGRGRAIITIGILIDTGDGGAGVSVRTDRRCIGNCRNGDHPRIGKAGAGRTCRTIGRSVLIDGRGNGCFGARARSSRTGVCQD